MGSDRLLVETRWVKGGRGFGVFEFVFYIRSYCFFLGFLFSKRDREWGGEGSIVVKESLFLVFGLGLGIGV